MSMKTLRENNRNLFNTEIQKLIQDDSKKQEQRGESGEGEKIHEIMNILMENFESRNTKNPKIESSGEFNNNRSLIFTCPTIKTNFATYIAFLSLTK